MKVVFKSRADGAGVAIFAAAALHVGHLPDDCLGKSGTLSSLYSRVKWLVLDIRITGMVRGVKGI